MRVVRPGKEQPTFVAITQSFGDFEMELDSSRCNFIKLINQTKRPEVVTVKNISMTTTFCCELH